MLQKTIGLKIVAAYREENYTVCPGSSDPFYIVTYYINWVTTFWANSNIRYAM